MAFLLLLLAFNGLSVAHPRIVRADEAGTLSATPASANSGKVITVVVSDLSPGTRERNTAEATDFTGNPYELPAGPAGEQHVFRVQNGHIADMDGDDRITGNDIITSLSSVGVDWLNTQNGTFAVSKFAASAAPEPFTVTYRNEVLNDTTVDIRSSSDIEGFSMTLQETAPGTNIYTATFLTGTETKTANADSPTAATRPQIKVADGGVVTVEYSDTDPPTLVSDAVFIDTKEPVLEVQQLPNGVTSSNPENWVSVDVTDDRSGVELSAIEFTVDLDRDGVFGEAGEVLPASVDFSSELNQGWAAFAMLPSMTDGEVSWFATATDIAGNTARTDSSSDEGAQNHIFNIDTVPPGVTKVFLGDDYEAAKERTVTNQPDRIRVDFSEVIDAESVIPGRFLFGSLPATGATVYEDLPSSVFLEYEGLPSIAEPLQVLAGAVKDLLGLNSERAVIPAVDRLGPNLEVIFDTVITRDRVKITSRSPEDLASTPTVEINGVTFGAMTPTSFEREWIIELDDDLLTGAAAGDGVKNVEIAGFDRKGNKAHGGVAREDPSWPEGAHLFELDRRIKAPTILPAPNDIVKVVDPVITVSYADEGGEYPGDTHESVTVINAKLDGFDITALMEATTASSWTFQPGFMEAGAHELSIQSRDDAGNIHPASVLRFAVDPPPTPTPTPTLTPVPEPTEVPIEAPGGTPPPELINTPGPDSTPEPTASPGPTAEPVPSPEPTEVPAETPTPVATPVETPPAAVSPEPTVDVEATVQAIRSGDGSDDPDPIDSQQVASEYTLYGCGLPLANHGVAGGDYTIIGLGMLGLVFLARRRGGDENGDDFEDD